MCRCRICAVSPPSTAFKFFHSRRSDVAIPATECFSTTFHRFSSLAVPPRSSSPRTSSLYLCALLSPCPAPSSRTKDSLLFVVFAVRCRLQRSDPPLPPGRTPAVGVSLLLYRGALLRCPVGVPVAVRYGTPSVTPTRYDGGVRGCRSLLPGTPMLAQRAARPSPIGSERRVVGSRRTLRCWGCSRQRGGAPSLPRVPVRRPACTYTGRSRRAAPPGHAPVTGMTLAFAPSPSMDRSAFGDAVMGQPHRRAAVPVDPR